MIDGEFDVVVIGGGIVGSAIAGSATERGLRVALIEIGPADLDAQQPARPPVVCRGRPHLGCVAARNHVLGGNGHYWGGGLMRPPSLSLGDCLGIAGAPATGSAVDLGAHFAAVERRLGLRVAPARVPADLAEGLDERIDAAEICVLPGKLRNQAAIQLARLRSSLSTILTKSTLLGFDSEACGDCRKLRALWIEQNGVRSCVVGKKFVIAAGVVDSNLIVQRFCDELLPGADTAHFGRQLHDHWSVPIADVHLEKECKLRTVVAPRFRDGLIVGTHYELPAVPDWGARGFLHFTFNFDEVSPYRQVRRLLLLRQQGSQSLQLIDAALRLLPHLTEIARIGIERSFAKRLFLSDGIRVTATLDFEAFPNATNALRLDGERAILDWDIAAQDQASFLNLLAKCRSVLTGLEKRFAVRMNPRFNWDSESAASHYLHQVATDAYHLGGGLAAGSDSAVLDLDLRLRGTSNLHIVSSAAFARPGIVNPTHCLLALAERLSLEISEGV